VASRRELRLVLEEPSNNSAANRPRTDTTYPAQSWTSLFAGVYDGNGLRLFAVSPHHCSPQVLSIWHLESSLAIHLPVQDSPRTKKREISHRNLNSDGTLRSWRPIR